MTQELTKDQMDAEVQNILENEGYDGFVRGLFNRTGDLSKDFSHAVLGLATECYELIKAPDHVNGVEEGGDLMFYYVALDQVLQDCGWLDAMVSEEQAYRGHASVEYSLGHTAQEAMDFALNQLQDIAKRWVGYGKQPEGTTTAITLHAGAALRAAMQISCLRFSNQGNIEPVLIRANIAKLLKRYKGKKFNAEHAVNRDVVAERVVLEDAAAGS